MENKQKTALKTKRLTVRRRRHFAVERLSDKGKRLISFSMLENWTLRQALDALYAVTGEKLAESALCRYYHHHERRNSTQTQPVAELVVREGDEQTGRSFFIEVKKLNNYLSLIR